MNILRQLQQRRLINARKPAGRFGRLLMRVMNVSHDPMTAWGLSHLTIGKRATILDVGCGGGRTIHKLAGAAPDGKVYGIDYSAESVTVSRLTNKEFVQRGCVDIQQGSVSRLPFPESQFDLVTAVNTHYFWPDLVADMLEIRRVLKPGGKFIIISSVYAGGKHDKRNQRYAELVELTCTSLTELHEAFVMAGYGEVQMFEKRQRSWICGMGRKPG